MPQGGGGATRACPSLPLELWENVLRHVDTAADKARLCAAVRCLCKPLAFRNCLILHTTERMAQGRLVLVSTPRWFCQDQATCMLKLICLLQPADNTDISKCWSGTNTPREVRSRNRHRRGLLAQVVEANLRLKSVERTLLTHAQQMYDNHT